MKKTLLLFSVDRRTTGVQVQDEPRRVLLNRSDKLTDEEIFDPLQIGLNPLVAIILSQARSQFHTIEGAFARQALASIFFPSALLSKDILLPAGRRQKRIDPQPIVIVEVFVTANQPVDALPDQSQYFMLDQILVSSVLETGGETFGDPKAAIQLTDEHTTRITGDSVPVHLNDHGA